MSHGDLNGHLGAGFGLIFGEGDGWGGWGCGFVRRGRYGDDFEFGFGLRLWEIPAESGEIEKGGTELAIGAIEIAAEEFHAFDVESVGWLRGVGGDVWVGGKGAGVGFAGESLPGEGEVEAGVSVFEGEIFIEAIFLDGELKID